MKPSVMLFPLVIAVVVIAFYFINPQSPSPVPAQQQIIPVQNATTTCLGSAACFTATVTKIVDGDTLDVIDNGNTTTRIRLTLTNTPERGQDGWAEATAFTDMMCSVGSTVLVDEDDGQIEGSYGRMIAKVTCTGGLTLDAQDGKPAFVINLELLRAGHAVISTNFCDESEFASEGWAQQYGC